MNDQVTASTKPRAASTRRVSLWRSCASVSTGFATPAARVIGVAGTLSTPTSRTTSSTRSAGPVMSGRHEGGAALSAFPLPSSPTPSAVRSCLISRGSRSSPLKRLTSPRSNLNGRFAFGGLPAMMTLLGSRRKARAPGPSQARAPAPRNPDRRRARSGSARRTGCRASARCAPCASGRNRPTR